MKRICVFCGSYTGKQDFYMAAARQMGAGIAAEGWELVYGGGHVGLMGAVA
ncbi:MAG: TIGR00730 family Rossman fold protein, partial [Anaerolineae bacterium]|nr:TIGR00730 family Rossman fold protein [Anaerolineae bacterium]